MSNSFKVAGLVLLVIVLTLLTQVGGIILLISVSLGRTKIIQSLKRFRAISFFLVIYLVSTVLIIPVFAELFGRTPLPVFDKPIKPLNYLSCLLNRHYARREMTSVLQQAAKQLNDKYPGTVIFYLDASFPFFDGFPLIPHLSHHDGRKLDICFFYQSKTGLRIAGNPSIIGYGVYEGPRKTETNTPDYCNKMGYWQYGILEKIVPQFNKSNYLFDKERTRELAEAIVSNPLTRSIYIEPHLKERLKLLNPKVKFHGCNAIRHDDHLHINLN